MTKISIGQVSISFISYHKSQNLFQITFSTIFIVPQPFLLRFHHIVPYDASTSAATFMYVGNLIIQRTRLSL